MPNLCKCGAPAEWAGEYCQDCWEEYCASRFWNLIRSLAVEEGAENVPN